MCRSWHLHITLVFLIATSYLHAQSTQFVHFCESAGEGELQASDTNALNYQWNTGEITPSITVNEAGYYWVDVELGSTTLRDSFKVEFWPAPVIGYMKTSSGMYNGTIRWHFSLEGSFIGKEGTVWEVGGVYYDTNRFVYQHPYSSHGDNCFLVNVTTDKGCGVDDTCKSICMIANNSAQTTGTCFPVSIEENSLPELKVFPNPTSDYVRVSGLNREASFVVRNAMGQRCMEGHTSNIIDLQSMPDGYYFIEIKQGGLRWVDGILKQ